MKIVILSAAFMLLTLCCFSQYDYKFNYQAVVRSGTGTLVPSGSTVSFRISILEGSDLGAVLYRETQSVVVNNPQGIVNLVIGDGVATVGTILFSGNFEDLSQAKFLKIEVDPAGGTAYTDMGATKLQFVPYAAHAFTSSHAEFAENGTQWADGAGSSISYTSGNVNIGITAPTGTSSLNIEKSTSTDHVMSVMQTGNSGGASKAAIYGHNNATGTSGVGVIGNHLTDGTGVVGRVGGNGTGIFGTAGGVNGTGVYANGATAVRAISVGSTGVSIELDGFMKVSGTKRTAFKTTPLVTATSNITLTYAGAAATDMIFVTPVNTSTTMPSWSLIWTSPNWVLWNASDDAIPSNFPAGTSFNVLIIKQ